jgi:CubicO group peptidase (beta-lactamase class C family)
VISRDDQGLFDAWSPDGRGGITLADMLGMASDLEWNEGYGYVSDVTRMLYLEPDMAAFAAAKPFDEQSPGGIGEVFNYSSGTSVMLSRIWQDRMGTPDSAMAYPGQALFGPLRMLSAVLETDARGTIVGSSYLYATARDWARFGQFLLQRGVWEGRSLLPVGYVDWMSEPHPASEGVYGRGHLWTRPPQSWLETDMSGVPDDAYFLSGHDGQMIAVVPSSGLVVVRLGLTPSTLGHRRIPLVQALLETLDN